MQTGSAPQPRQRLGLFFLLTLAISWAIWLPQAAAALGRPVVALPLDAPLMLLAVWAPGVAAALLALKAGGLAGIRSLLRPLRLWRVGARWYLFALLFPAAIWLAGRGIDALLGVRYDLRSPLAALGAPAAGMLPVLILLALPNALGEELGWRGFALPRLQARAGALGASVALGLLWGLWHVPTLIAQHALEPTAPAIAAAIVGPVPLALLYTWLFNHTRRSLLPVWLLHASDAATQYVLPRLPTPTDDLLILAAALLVLALDWQADLGSRAGGAAPTAGRPV